MMGSYRIDLVLFCLLQSQHYEKLLSKKPIQTEIREEKDPMVTGGKRLTQTCEETDRHRVAVVDERIEIVDNA